MELKQGTAGKSHKENTLLIVPYGIETLNAGIDPEIIAIF